LDLLRIFQINGEMPDPRIAEMSIRRIARQHRNRESPRQEALNDD